MVTFPICYLTHVCGTREDMLKEDHGNFSNLLFEKQVRGQKYSSFVIMI